MIYEKTHIWKMQDLVYDLLFFFFKLGKEALLVFHDYYFVKYLLGAQ